jgi:hypothetical protein
LVTKSTQDEERQDIPIISVHGLIEGVFDIQNDGAMRQEIEVALELLIGAPIRGTLTPV